MSILVFLGVSGLLFVVAVALLAIRPNFFAIPWLGMVLVVVGTAWAFSVSAHLVAEGHDGVGIGPLITFVCGLLGLGIVGASVRFRAVPFVPLGAIVAGIIYIGSFYAYLPPFNADFAGWLPITAPGFLLAAYGGYLWYRHGLAGSLQHRSLFLRLFLALAIVAGLGTLGFLQFERPGPHKLLANPPNLPRIAGESALVVEGVVVNKESFRYKVRPEGRSTSDSLSTKRKYPTTGEVQRCRLFTSPSRTTAL